jgi:hypothetical protein
MYRVCSCDRAWRIRHGYCAAQRSHDASCAPDSDKYSPPTPLPKGRYVCYNEAAKWGAFAQDHVPGMRATMPHSGRMPCHAVTQHAPRNIRCALESCARRSATRWLCGLTHLSPLPGARHDIICARPSHALCAWRSGDSPGTPHPS